MKLTYDDACKRQVKSELQVELQLLLQQRQIVAVGLRSEGKGHLLACGVHHLAELVGDWLILGGGTGDKELHMSPVAHAAISIAIKRNNNTGAPIVTEPSLEMSRSEDTQSFAVMIRGVSNVPLTGIT